MSYFVLGLVVVLPLIDSQSVVDLRMKAFSIPPSLVRFTMIAVTSDKPLIVCETLQIVTSDDCTIEVGAEVFYHVKDVVMVVNNVKVSLE